MITFQDEITDGAAKYRIKDSNGNTLYDNLTIEMVTTILQEGTDFTAELMNTLIQNPMTTQGDIIYGGTNGLPTRLAKGTAGQTLVMNSGATAPEWGNASKLVRSYTLPSAATSFTISDLDINTDGGLYEIVVENLVAAAGSVIIYINGDTTSTNYYSGTTFNSTNTTNGSNGFSVPTTATNGIIYLSFSGSYATARIQYERYNSANVYLGYTVVEHKSAQSNITSITLANNGANNINSAIVKIYKK